MAGTAPSFYNMSPISRNGISGGDAHKAIYNLFLALYYLCSNIDDDAGTIDSDYMSKLGTPLTDAGIGTELPLGAADSVAGSFYTPSDTINWNGMSQSDIYTAFYDLGIAFYSLCDQLDGDNGVALGTDYMTYIGTPLEDTLGSKLSAPAEGLITGTYFYGLEGYVENGCFAQGDLHKCLYDFYQAIVRICTLLDAGAGTMPATLLTNVGTPLNTAVGAFIRAPVGATTTGS